jgi:2-C-methyl-D-erythritol 4-phosphate cytidylyltransferase
MNFCIITAGGSGTRMGTELPKQFLELHKKVVLMHTIEQFYAYDKLLNIIVSLPSAHIEYWNELCAKYKFKIAHEIVEGGETRFHSVQNALQLVHSEGYTAIHDGVRPLVTIRAIASGFDTAQKFGTGIASSEIVFSLRKISLDGTSEAVNRAEYREIQTPQVFKNDLIKKSYGQTYRPEFTDDATVAEYAGYKIAFSKGSRENIKITNPEDLHIAQILMKARWS